MLIMLTPTPVDIVSFFYPIGNTPAVCLTQDLPYKQAADVLLLGCGDVRNVLFTTYADIQRKESVRGHELSLTSLSAST